MLLAFYLPFSLVYDRFHLLRYGADSWVGFGCRMAILLLEMRWPGSILGNFFDVGCGR